MNKKTQSLHIGIILDGNRRWARERGLPSFLGHQKGSDKVKKLFGWMKELDVNELTLYCFSMQNFQRSKKEVKFLMDLFCKDFLDIIKEQDIYSNKVKLRVIGRKNLLSEKLQLAISKMEDLTKNHNQHIVNFALAHGGREEITDALKDISQKVKEGIIKLEEINEQLVFDHLWLKTEPDLIIRTGGDYRTSNFLVWQQIYSEWFFIKKYWPDFTKQDLKEIIENFYLRKRRLGK